MNILWKQLAGIVLIAYSMMVMADRAQDEADIRDVIKQINAACTRQDAHAIAPFLAEDFETWNGIMGRKDVSEAWANERDHYRRLEDLGVRFITDEAAIF